MKRQIPGLHFNQHGVENTLEGLFLVRVERAQYRWRPQKPFVEFRFGVLEPKSFEGRPFSGRLYCTEKALWRLNWFLHDFGYERSSSRMTASMKRPSSISVESFGLPISP